MLSLIIDHKLLIDESTRLVASLGDLDSFNKIITEYVASEGSIFRAYISDFVIQDLEGLDLCRLGEKFAAFTGLKKPI